MSSVEVAAEGPNARVQPVRDLRAFLRGGWRIARTVKDARSGQDGGFDGTAVFAPLPDGGLLLTESGTMRLGGYTGPAEQTYRYHFPTVPDGRRSFATTARRSTTWIWRLVPPRRSITAAPIFTKERSGCWGRKSGSWNGRSADHAKIIIW